MNKVYEAFNQKLSYRLNEVFIKCELKHDVKLHNMFIDQQVGAMFVSVSNTRRDLHLKKINFKIN